MEVDGKLSVDEAGEQRERHRVVCVVDRLDAAADACVVGDLRGVDHYALADSDERAVVGITLCAIRVAGGREPVRARHHRPLEAEVDGPVEDERAMIKMTLLDRGGAERIVELWRVVHATLAQRPSSSRTR